MVLLTTPMEKGVKTGETELQWAQDADGWLPLTMARGRARLVGLTLLDHRSMAHEPPLPATLPWLSDRQNHLKQDSN
jgi:hypothetical protein